MTSSSTLISSCATLLLALFAQAGDVQAQDVVIAPQFENAGNFHKGVAPVLLDKRWGLVDRSGAWILRPRYTDMRLGGNGVFPVQDGGVWGYIDTTGRFVITPKFEDAEPFQNGVAAVKMRGRWGYVRTDGTMEADFIFLEIGGREGPYVSARDAEGWAVFKLVGSGPPKRESIGPGTVQRAYSISEGTVIAQLGKDEQVFEIMPQPDQPDQDDENNKDEKPKTYKQNNFTVNELFPAWDHPGKYVSIRRMSDGFAPARTERNRWGYLHKGSGEFLWEGRFQDAFGFAQGFAPVKINGKWGYIDRAGRIAIPATYDAAFPFRGNYAVIRQGEKRGFLRLDPQGGISVFIAPRYEDAFRFTEGLAPVKIGERWGYVSDGQPWRELVETDIVDVRPQ